MSLRFNSELELKALLKRNPRLRIADGDASPKEARAKVLVPLTLPRQITDPVELKSTDEKMVQGTFFDWVITHQERFPELELFHAIPNGSNKSRMERWVHQYTGLRKGYPDTQLPVARNGYSSYVIEFKRPIGGTLSEDQKRMIELLQRYGNKVDVHTSAHDAAVAVLRYLGVAHP